MANFCKTARVTLTAMSQPIRLPASIMCIALILGGTTACASGAPSGEDPKEVILHYAEEAQRLGYDSQYEALEDGQVTKSEHDAAFENLKACLAASGIEVSNVTTNLVDGVTILFEMEGDGLKPEVFDKVQKSCNEDLWDLVDLAYTTTTPKVMDQALRVAAIECLAKAGYDVSDDAQSFADMVGAGGADDEQRLEATSTCVVEQAKRLYPDVPALAFGM